jgi:hypothetical protein
MQLFLWGYLKQRVYYPLAKSLEDIISNFTREIENIPAEMLKDTFLYLTINGILSSLKWYITCEMVTRGYFLIDVLKMQILRIYPVPRTPKLGL